MSSRDEEAAPLLRNGGPNHDQGANGDYKGPDAREKPLFHVYSRRIWRWLSNNVRILAITGLLFGGLVAFVVYIARMASLSSS